MKTPTDSADRAFELDAFEVELERQVAALLEPDHERVQFERLWTRIVTADPTHAAQRMSALRRRTVPFGALAATLLLGAGAGWYRDATAPDYTTLADPPRHACGSLRVQVVDAPNAARAAIDASGAQVVGGPDADGIYTLAAPDPIEALRILRASPGIRLAEPTNC